MRASEWITEKLIMGSVIPREDKELYTYGFQQGFALFYNLVTVIVIGVIFDMIWQCLIFTIAYSCIRPYAGGYHARTQAKCYIFSVVMLSVVLSLIKLVQGLSVICLYIMVVACILILVLAPVEDRNKPLDHLEKMVYRKKSYVILSCLTGAAILFFLLGFQVLFVCISMALIAISFMLVLGRLNNIYHQVEKQESR